MSTLEQFVSQGVAAQQAVDDVAGKSIPTIGAVDANQDEYLVVPLTAIQESPLNPRKTFDLGALEEMAASMRQLGVLEPLLVRPAKGPAGKKRLEAPRFELVAGARRLRAATLAGLDSVPVRVKHLDDKQVLEVMVVENLQRDGLQPLEEAEGYRVLHEEHGYSVNELAAKIGKSREYVYARLKLRGLTEESRQLLLDRKITPGHAILLARLNADDQERAIGDGLFTSSRMRWQHAQVADDEGYLPDDLAVAASPSETKPNQDGDKAASVRELQAWIDDHVRFEAAAPDPILHADTAATLAAAAEAEEKVVHISHNHHVDPEAKEEGKRTYGPQSWKRADGQRGSKACDDSVLGVIVVGPGRGEAFRVCIAKDRCTVHWGAEIRAKKPRAKAAEQGGGKASSQRLAREDERRRGAEARQAAARARWQKAVPAILEAVAGAVKKAPTKTGGLLARAILDEIRDYSWAPFRENPAKYVPLGTTAEDLVRHLGFMVIASDAYDYNAQEYFPERAKAIGIDVQKILAAAAPEKKEEKAKPAGKRARKSRR